MRITIEISSFSARGLATLLPRPVPLRGCSVGGGRGVTAAPLQGQRLSGLLLFTLLCSGSTLPVECRANGHFPHPLFNCEPSISGFYLKFVVERALDVELGDLSLLRGWLFSMFDLQDDIFHGKGLTDR